MNLLIQRVFKMHLLYSGKVPFEDASSLNCETD